MGRGRRPGRDPEGRLLGPLPAAAVRPKPRRRVRAPGEIGCGRWSVSGSSLADLAELHGRGKVRDIFEAGSDLLLVATDRISAFDVVLPTAIPTKGQVLTGLSLSWFEQTKHLVQNHLLTANVAEFPEPYAGRFEELAGRAML